MSAPSGMTPVQRGTSSETLRVALSPSIAVVTLAIVSVGRNCGSAQALAFYTELSETSETVNQ